MINSRALKAFLYAFLLVLAGGLVFIGSAAQGLSTAGALAIIGLALMFLGLLTGLVACLA
jgi:hypothetical protein